MNIRELERIRIVIRLPQNHTIDSDRYGYAYAADQNFTLANFISVRIRPFFPGMPDVVGVSGNGNIAHGALRLRSLRDTYRGN